TDDSGSQLCMLSYGTYTVTATDGNGCQATSTVVIDSIQELVLGFEAFPPLCHGQTGQLAITVAGGTAPYEVVWSNGNIGLVNPGLLAQNHAATVTDALGCANTLDIIPLTEPDVLEVTLENIEGIVCHNGREGAIDISVRGGTMPYRFMWSNGSTTEDLSSIPEGNYSVVVTDDHGCTSMLHNLVVVSPSPLVPSSSLVAPSSNCQTVQVDEICVMVSGGLAPYDFVWDTGATTDCLTDPLPGDYHVTITDAAGCTLEFMSLKVPESYASISLQPASASSDTICFGDSSGVLNVSIQGGIGPFQFNWSNGLAGLASDAAISNIDLPIGQYQVTVTDNGGCTAVSPILEIVTFSAVTPTFNSNAIENVSCKYGSDGSIPVSVTGGLSPYAYHWEDAQGNILPSNSQTIENLMAGDYSVTVTDQLGCTGSASTEVTEPETSFQLSGVQINNVGCFGQNDGQIIPNYQGGELLYEFSWSNGAFTPSITNLPIGTYSVTTTDANGCQLIDSFTIIGPDGPVTVETLDILDVTCFGASDGSIDIEIEGGTPNYTVNWNNISGEEDLTDAPAGNYVLTIFDSQGCPYTANFTIGTPPLLFLDLSATNQTQMNPPNGGVSATVLGGTPPYSYNWTNGSGSPVQTGLAAGVYGLTVTDSNLCETTQWVEVDLVLGLHENTGDGSVFIHPNPTAGIARLAFPSDVSSDFETKVFNHLGQLVFFKTGCKTSNGSYEVDLTGQVPGFYQLVLLDEMGHVFEGKILVVR
ncbi:MAG: SprB repeat-containing protein, partial [Saprospiraceae bacterium]|nr:SprB repeat-containing protein [Saprospiraceae bacterium]